MTPRRGPCAVRRPWPGFGLLHWMALLSPGEPGRAAAALAVAARSSPSGPVAARRGAPGRARSPAASRLARPVAGALGRARGDRQRRASSAVGSVRAPLRAAATPTVRLVIGSGRRAARRSARRSSPAAGGAPGLIAARRASTAFPSVAVGFDAEFARGAVLALLVVAYVCARPAARSPTCAPAAGLAVGGAVARAGRRAGAGRRRAVVRLRGVRSSAATRPRSDRPSAGSTTTARCRGRARAARCCAVASPAPDLLEGRDARPLRRRALDARPDRRRAARRRRTTASTRATSSAGRSTSRSASAGCAPTPCRSPPWPGRVRDGRGSTPNLEAPGIWHAGRDLRRGDSYPRGVYVPEPTRRDCRRRRTGCVSAAPIVENLDPGRRRRAGPRRPRRARSRASARPAVRTTSTRPTPRSRSAHRTSGGPGGSPAGCSPDAETPYAYLRNVQRHLARGYSLRRDAAAASRARSTASCSTSQIGFCQHYSGRDGAAAAHGRRARARGDRLRARARSTTDRSATWCATWTPTPGWRRGSTASAGSSSTRRPPPRRRARRRCRARSPPASATAATWATTQSAGRRPSSASGRGPLTALAARPDRPRSRGAGGRGPPALAPHGSELRDEALERRAATGRRPGHDAVGCRAPACPRRARRYVLAR